MLFKNSRSWKQTWKSYLITWLCLSSWCRSNLVHVIKWTYIYEFPQDENCSYSWSSLNGSWCLHESIELHLFQEIYRVHIWIYSIDNPSSSSVWIHGFLDHYQMVDKLSSHGKSQTSLCNYRNDNHEYKLWYTWHFWNSIYRQLNLVDAIPFDCSISMCSYYALCETHLWEF